MPSKMVFTIELRKSVSESISQLAEQLRFRQRMIKEAVAVAKEITQEKAR